MSSFTPPSPGETITSYQGITYRIENELGRGSFGIVYLCSDEWENELAAKVLLPGQIPHEQLRDDWNREVANLVTFRNPFITFVHDAFEYRNTFYIITELCLATVRDMIGGRSLDERFIIPIARCLLQAVQYIHSINYIHKDIHAGNVLWGFSRDEIKQTGSVTIRFKLGDLGISKLVGDINVFNTMLNPWMLPPEYLGSARFGTIDHRMDIYHCGLLFLHLFHGSELQFTQEEIIAGKPQEMAEDLKPPYNSALSKALERHVTKRTSSAIEFWRNLKAKTT